MANDHQLRSAKHWRDKAEEARTMATQMRNASARAVMEDIAEKYERMAERAARREAGPAIKYKERSPNPD